VNSQEYDLPETWPRTHLTPRSGNVPINRTTILVQPQTSGPVSTSPHQLHQRKQGSNALRYLCLDFGSGADGGSGIERLALGLTTSVRFVWLGVPPSEVGRGELSEFLLLSALVAAVV